MNMFLNRESSDQLESSGYAMSEEDKVHHLIVGLDRDFMWCQ